MAYSNPRSIEVSDNAPTHKRVSKLLWCRDCRDGRHKSCTGIRRELRNGTRPCECPECKEKK
jgi:hypothetical protein